MNIKVVLEAKLKESFYKEGAFEYQKRLSGKVDIIEVNNILEYLKNKKNSYIITLEIEGKSLSSEELANKIKEIEHDGNNELIFLIGGAFGLCHEARKKSDYKLSLSKLTFLHQETVLILMEQIYRAHKILSNEPYHK